MAVTICPVAGAATIAGWQTKVVHEAHASQRLLAVALLLKRDQRFCRFVSRVLGEIVQFLLLK